jgi:sugar lactone lactonase YvrE
MRGWTLVVVCGCSGPTPAATERPPIEAKVPTTSRYPSVDLPGDGNGVYWDAKASALYLTDDTHDQLVRWTDRGGFEVFAALPKAKRTSLGALVRLPDGSLVTASLGFGTDGAVFRTSAAGETTSLEHVDPARRRIGLASDGEGGVYEAYFVVTDGHHHGGVAHLGADGVEHELVAEGLAKPIGVAASDATLYVADQEARTLFAMSLAPGGSTELRTVARDLPSADLLTVLPDGDLVTGGTKGAVLRITPAGAVSTIAEGFEQVRGTAYDPAGKRLFVVDHSRASSHHSLHIVPLER